MPQAAPNIDRLSEAMRTLDDLATQEKDEIKELLSTQFRNLKKTLLEIEPEVRGTVRRATERLGEFATDSKNMAQQRIRQVGDRIDHKVHERPWTFMGVATCLGILGGFCLGAKLSNYRK